MRKTKNDRKNSFIITEVIRFEHYTETVPPKRNVCRTFGNSLGSEAGLWRAADYLEPKTLCSLNHIFLKFTSSFFVVFGITLTEILQWYADLRVLTN